MKNISITLSYKEFDSINDLPLHLQRLLQKAKEAVANAYAPYSNFYVGAAALLADGNVVTGSNQENASSPVGICAERVTLSAASAMFPGIKIVAMAISARQKNHSIHVPVMPCGLCRQSLVEYTERFEKSIELVLQGETGNIIWMDDARKLMPLSFGNANLKIV